MASLSDTFGQAVSQSILLKQDPNAQLGIQVGGLYLKGMEADYDLKVNGILKGYLKDLRKEEARDKPNAKVIKAYYRMIKKYSK